MFRTERQLCWPKFCPCPANLLLLPRACLSTSPLAPASPSWGQLDRADPERLKFKTSLTMTKSVALFESLSLSELQCPHLQTRNKSNIGIASSTVGQVHGSWLWLMLIHSLPPLPWEILLTLHGPLKMSPPLWNLPSLSLQIKPLPPLHIYSTLIGPH